MRDLAKVVTSKHGRPYETEDTTSEADVDEPTTEGGAMTKAGDHGGHDSPQARMGHPPKGSGGEPLKKHDKMEAGREKPYGKKAPRPKQSVFGARKDYR